MAMKCRKCGYVMETFQEIQTFIGDFWDTALSGLASLHPISPKVFWQELIIQNTVKLNAQIVAKLADGKIVENL